MKKIFFILLALHFVLLITYSQPSITWQRYYVTPVGLLHENYGYDICNADGDNFYVIGSSTQPAKGYIIKINPYGDTIWTKLIDSMYAVAGVSTPDGGCVITGDYSPYPHYPFGLKLNSLGNIEWLKVYPGNPLTTCYKIIQTSEDNYIMCGYKGYYLGVIVKVDSSGNLIWQREYSSTGYKFYDYIAEAHNGGYIAVGYITNNVYNTAHGIIDKIDTAGNVIWEKEYSINGIRIQQLKSVQKINNGYITTGWLYDSTANKNFSAYLKIDTSGNINADQIFYDSLRQVLTYDIRAMNNNRYVLCALLYTLNSYDVYSSAYIIDSSGDILKKRIYDQTGIIAFNRILPLNNGDIMFVGNCNYHIPDIENALVVRTDSNLYAPPIGIVNIQNEFPDNFELYQNYPNPFNPSTKIKFSIPAVGQRHAFDVRMVIYDILGKEVAVLVNHELKPGIYEVNWDGTNYPSGVYFYRLETQNYFETKKMVLMK